jgi:hypothetical protein
VATISAERGHYYFNRRNRFSELLAATGRDHLNPTPRRWRPTRSTGGSAEPAVELRP